MKDKFALSFLANYLQNKTIGTNSTVDDIEKLKFKDALEIDINLKRKKKKNKIYAMAVGTDPKKMVHHYLVKWYHKFCHTLVA